MKTRFIITCVLILAAALAGHAQSQPPVVPQWQIAAGGKMSFDVASVKQNKSGLPSSGSGAHTNVGLGDMDDASPNGGLLSAVNFPLATFIGFAYKLSPYQSQLVRGDLPKWAITERFDIEARSSVANPTGDQMRLMMQSLLSDRFKLVVHSETKQMEGFGVALEKAGKTGPQLIHLSEDMPCPTSSSISAVGSTQPPPKYDGWFTPCGGVGARFVSGRVRVGSQNVTMTQVIEMLAITSMGALDQGRPLFDQTRLGGKFDFMIEFTPEFHGPSPPNFQADPSGPTFFEALKEQLGLKMESTKGPVHVLVVDHIEQPSPN